MKRMKSPLKRNWIRFPSRLIFAYLIILIFLFFCSPVTDLSYISVTMKKYQSQMLRFHVHPSRKELIGIYEDERK